MFKDLNIIKFTRNDNLHANLFCNSRIVSKNNGLFAKVMQYLGCFEMFLESSQIYSWQKKL
jgi:hypothetical protein